MYFLNGSTLSFYRDRDFYCVFFLSKRIIADIIETSASISHIIPPIAKFTILYTNHEGEQISAILRTVRGDLR